MMFSSPRWASQTLAENPEGATEGDDGGTPPNYTAQSCLYAYYEILSVSIHITGPHCFQTRRSAPEGTRTPNKITLTSGSTLLKSASTFLFDRARGIQAD